MTESSPKNVVRGRRARLSGGGDFPTSGKAGTHAGLGYLTQEHVQTPMAACARRIVSVRGTLPGYPKIPTGRKFRKDPLALFLPVGILSEDLPNDRLQWMPRC